MKRIKLENGQIEYEYKFALIRREEDSKRINWACYIDGARRDFDTLKAAKLHIDSIAQGFNHQGLH